MLGASPFYYRTIRTCTAAFGTLFKDIMVVRSNVDHDNEFYRVRVPVTQIAKEKFIQRLNEDPNLTKSIEVALPQITYYLEPSLTYNQSRRKQITEQFAAITSTSAASLGSVYTAAPWDLSFSVSIFTRSTDDAAQIIEQILPFFARDYTLSINYVPELNIVRNTPVILSAVNFNNAFDGTFDEVRQIEIDLSFTMQTEFWGPVIEQAVIMTATAKIYDAYGDWDNVVLDMYPASGTGTYITGDTVYQGKTLESATAIGQVAEWTPNIARLRLANTSGIFVSNVQVKSATSSNGNSAFYTVQTSEITPQQLVQITEQVTPANTPNVNVPGWTIVETKTEWPNL